MYGLAAPQALVSRRRMAAPTRHQAGLDEAAAIGQAIAALRERANMSQEDLAERLGVARQTVSRYEGGRSTVLRLDVQRDIADAIGCTVEAIMAERDNILEFPGRPALPVAALAPMMRVRTEVEIKARPDFDEDGEIRYREGASGTSEDLAWLFGPDAGFLHLADGALPGGLSAMRFAGYDRSTWPRRGQPCVVETRDGELLPRVYEQRTPAGVVVRKSDDQTETIPSTKVKGVYTIRIFAD